MLSFSHDPIIDMFVIFVLLFFAKSVGSLSVPEAEGTPQNSHKFTEGMFSVIFTHPVDLTWGDCISAHRKGIVFCVVSSWDSYITLACWKLLIQRELEETCILISRLNRMKLYVKKEFIRDTKNPKYHATECKITLSKAFVRRTFT